MKSFSSSAINKSGKKFAPKAPARRGAPAPAAPARRPSAVQQSQVQSAQNAQQERDVRGSVGSIAPSSVASVEPEPLAIPETTPPVTVAQTQERPPIISRPATSIPIPRPKRRGSVSTPATQEPTIAPTPPNDVPPSPRSSAIEPPAESEIVPSIEQDVELPAGHGVTVPSTQPADDAVAPNEITSPRPTAVQTSAPIAAPRPSFMPVEYQPAKRAKKTSEITKSRQKSQSRVSVSGASTGDAGSETPGGSLAPSTPEPSQASKTSKKRKQSRAGASDAEEGAETVEILPNVMKMSELCKDLKTGKKSKRRESASQAKGPSGPVMRIVNGEIVLDTASLEVDRHADAAREAGDLEDVVENQLTRKINQASYGKRSKTESWDEEMTDLFYRGLRMFGTDFMIISNMFPGRSRRQIKLKFNNEERRDPQRIRDTLMGPREVVDIETYTAMTNQTYDDPKVIQQELDEEKRAIEEQHEKEKQLHEEMMRNPTGGAEEDTKGDKGKGTGKGKSRNSKRQAKNLGGGGTEEVLGSIDEIPAF
ncbi:hypothetical protein N7450_001380 [Penicillium hetheringtonii]|uniref:Myb-like domain-containing protein n=1 Tax=Penicillium hetheringtonii TaxID=911720 RepID=A0AAD6E592_9EURO|nr:hypothetical protein N7450_001380 [Penicillium hetheringtonii]